MKIQAKLFPES